MLEFHYWPSPNGQKVLIFLEETATSYQLAPVNILKGEQFRPQFLAISPNNRIPAMVDTAPQGGGAPVSVFESGAILLYLARKTGCFWPATPTGAGPPWPTSKPWTAKPRSTPSARRVA